ncbi:hypothetical protein C2E23DRAFT_827817 [Lenzites betulinus]|nr:hypothetical protein C2E23DRAFT_827817 [Lenzites betulinus]
MHTITRRRYKVTLGAHFLSLYSLFAGSTQGSYFLFTLESLGRVPGWDSILRPRTLSPRTRRAHSPVECSSLYTHPWRMGTPPSG